MWIRITFYSVNEESNKQQGIRMNQRAHSLHMLGMARLCNELVHMNCLNILEPGINQEVIAEVAS